MSTQLIKTAEGVLIEVSASEEQYQQISADSADQVEKKLDQVESLLKKTLKPVISVWDELNRDLGIEEVNLKLALGFEAEGNIFIAKGTGSANIEINLKLKPKAE